jgi:hypothetical protein
MTSIKLVLCANQILRDADTENVAIIGLYDGIASPGFPLLIQNFAALAVLERDPAVDAADVNGTFELRLGDTVLIHQDIQGNFRDKARTRLILRVDGLVIPAPGLLRVDVSFAEGQLAGHYTFPVDRLAGQHPQVIVVPAIPVH